MKDLTPVVGPGSETVHLAHRYRPGTYFALCGLHQNLAEDDGAQVLTCRRCRAGASEQLRTALETVAELEASLDRHRERIDLLRAVLGAREEGAA